MTAILSASGRGKNKKGLPDMSWGQSTPRSAYPRLPTS
jgi:hypothetical protein